MELTDGQIVLLILIVVSALAWFAVRMWNDEFGM